MKNLLMLLAIMVVGLSVNAANVKSKVPAKKSAPPAANAIASSGATVLAPTFTSTGGFVWDTVNFTSGNAVYDTDS